ncbi:MAG: zinc-dependent metalloprotease, partial [Candidatus Acidiferrales bacterium]
MRTLRAALIALVLVAATTARPQEQRAPSQQPPAGERRVLVPGATTIAEKTVGMERRDGFFPFYWDAKGGKIWLEIPAGSLKTEFLYVNSLPAGLGSNDIGLDRGQLGADRIVKFERSGPKILLIQPNYDYRAITDNAAERRAVEQAFAQSALWGFEVVAEEDGRVLIDATNFFLRDAHNVIGRLRGNQQGTYRLDASRSAFYLDRTKNFPKNTEVEATLTFTSDQPGRLVGTVAPSADSVTLRQHHSFVELPGPGYTPRAFDPRAGYFGISYFDYATPIDSPIQKRFIARHRLARKDLSAARSEPMEPIIYYLDPGTPEPIRSALLDGARWWAAAFDAAGYINAFRVEMLPEDADPMDVRYNLIQWVHRSTRGWSYGSSVSDPRTGEIIKGHVSLGSLRVRQDFLIAEGLLAPYDAEPKSATSKGAASSAPTPKQKAALEMALARLRQLSAHEVGHTLGLSHNYIASVAGRASVMDYPHPLAKLAPDGTIDLSDAYTNAIGEWDKVAIAYGYTDFASGTNEQAALTKILTEAMQRGLIFLTDQDARPPGSAHPANHLWDNGTNAVDELERVLAVRAAALKRFGERNIKPGAPLAMIEEALVPLYMSHRYQAEAAVKVIGGMRYTYALRGDGQRPTEIVPAAAQRRALEAVLRTLSPEALALPEQLLRLIPPRPAGYGGGDRERFRGRTGVTFDAVAPAEAAAGFVASFLLHPERAARLEEFRARDANYPGLGEVVEALFAATIQAPAKDNM